MTDRDNQAAATCKRLEGRIKAVRARIRRMAKMPPGRPRQAERMFIAEEGMAAGQMLHEVVSSIILETE